jgi:hypothetical protein
MILTPFEPEGKPARKVVARAARKIALCGSHIESLADAPWDDPSWEFWGHGASYGFYRRAMNVYFDLHPKACWQRKGPKSNYPRWLARNTVPIFMQQHYPEAPASIPYPKGQILTEFSDCRPYFTNHVAWMIAYALTLGDVQTIGLFGINYGIESEYIRQRGSAEFWLGRAVGKGLRVVLPRQCSLLADPLPLYGYESHDETTGKLLPAYKPRVWENAEQITPLKPGEVYAKAQPPKELLAEIEAEARDFPRPDWALGPLPEGQPLNGQIHEEKQ